MLNTFCDVYESIRHIFLFIILNHFNSDSFDSLIQIKKKKNEMHLYKEINICLQD